MLCWGVVLLGLLGYLFCLLCCLFDFGYLFCLVCLLGYCCLRCFRGFGMVFDSLFLIWVCVFIGFVLSLFVI